MLASPWSACAVLHGTVTLVAGSGLSCLPFFFARSRCWSTGNVEEGEWGRGEEAVNVRRWI
eukprot:13973484-Alexandrium_andersonii.AAC.1